LSAERPTKFGCRGFAHEKAAFARFVDDAAGIKSRFCRNAHAPVALECFLRFARMEYRGHIQSLLVAQQVTFVDASAWEAGEQMFADRLHRTEVAAAQFSKRLGNLLRESQIAESQANRDNKPRAWPIHGR
jgi:hypothetical protein